jgi:hypothetical protein
LPFPNPGRLFSHTRLTLLFYNLSAKQAAAVAEAEVRVNILSDELTLEKASLAQKMESTKARLDALAKREAAAAIAETEALVYAKKAAADRLATAAARDAAEKLSAQLKGDAGQAASAMFAAERSWKQKETKTVAREQELRSAVARAEAEEVRLKEELCKIEATRSEIAGQTATLKEEKVSLEAEKKSARAASANAESRTREADEKQESALRTQSEASAKLDAATEAIAKLNLLKVTLDADAEAVHRQRRDFEASVAVAEKSKAAALNETDRFQKEVNVLKHERDAVSTELKLLERQRGEAERVVARGKEISSENAEVKLKVTKLEAFESSLRTKEQQIAAAAATLTRQSLQIDSQKAEVERSKQDARRIARLAAETQARREREWASAVLIEKAQLEHVKKSALVDTKEVTSLRETLAKERKAWSEERGCFESERQNVRAEFEARLARVSAEQEQTRHTAISQEEEASARKRRDDALFGLEKGTYFISQIQRLFVCPYKTDTFFYLSQRGTKRFPRYSRFKRSRPLRRRRRRIWGEGLVTHKVGCLPGPVQGRRARNAFQAHTRKEPKQCPGPFPIPPPSFRLGGCC